MSAALAEKTPPHATAIPAENRVRDFSPLGWPRVGVDVPISLERTGENGVMYDGARRQILYSGPDVSRLSPLRRVAPY